ncbi:hypothetical protein [Allosphingosinicella vermicomposti]|uniref:hypothetical protein n=1 Tax=Allosphingosinicella vermicomposti TaxID=614671 RepID=UPI00131A59D5|nr:hypothetical protein [Allosphingosinicella vermicomposti]
MSDQNTSDAPKKAPAAANPDDKKGWVKTGVAVGIGSAAIVAALLYANRSKPTKKRD